MHKDPERKPKEERKMSRIRNRSHRSTEVTAEAGAPTASSGQSRNVAARMGRWSASHWKTATFGWLALVVVAFAVGGAVGTKTLDPNAKGPGESGRMDKILDAGFKQPAGESVLIQNRSLQTGTPAFAAAVHDVVARLSKVAVVRNVQTAKIAADRHAVLIDFDISGDKDTAADRLDPLLASVDGASN